MAVTVEPVTDEGIERVIDALAALRIAVFADWPYLYDGDLAYEAAYLREFAAAPGAVLVLARDGERIVGAATASPLAAQSAEIRAPFEARGYDISGIFYFGESVLLPKYRGQGIGHAFFDHREAQARRCDARLACFASVMRPADHPARPADYRPLDAFWRARGYAPVPGLAIGMAWKDHGETAESDKRLGVWIRELRASETRTPT